MRTRTRNRLIAATVAKNRLVALGLAVIEAREQKGMSVSELAEASGIPLRRLERIEAGEPDPDSDATTDKTAPDPDLIALGRMVRAAREQKAMTDRARGRPRCSCGSDHAIRLTDDGPTTLLI